MRVSEFFVHLARYLMKGRGIFRLFVGFWKLLCHFNRSASKVRKTGNERDEFVAVFNDFS